MVRNRTLAHLEGLLALGAFATGCRADAADPPAPPPPTPPPDVQQLRYSVVDELPPPSRCWKFVECLDAQVTHAGGVVHLTLRPGEYRDVFLDPAKEPTVSHAILREQVFEHGQWTMDFVPWPSTQVVAVKVHGTWRGKPAVARVELRWTPPLTDASTIAVSNVAEDP